MSTRSWALPSLTPGVLVITALAGNLCSCAGQKAEGKDQLTPSQCLVVSVVRAASKKLERRLSVSAELIPFQQIDVYAKEAGYVRQLNVDYGTRVRAGQVMAVLEIPELQMQLDQDDALISDAADEIARAQHNLAAVEAQRQVAHLQYERLDGVAKSKPGLVAQQEVDDAQGKDLSFAAQVDSARAALQAAQSQLAQARAKRRGDQSLFDYSKITAPFDGIVTERYANLGTLMQSGTNSSTQALPLVQLSQDNIFRLAIPVAEAYVRYIRIGDPVEVSVPSLNRNLLGRVIRFAEDVKADTRTMHTEVDVPNPNRVLLPGLYAEAKLTLDSKPDSIAIPLEAIDSDSEQKKVWVVGSSNKLNLQDITLGIETPNDVEAVSGLKAGDLIVVGDRSGLKAGDTVCPKVVQLLEYQGEQ
jgi:RND family efflux transporter MFP subunit